MCPSSGLSSAARATKSNAIGSNGGQIAMGGRVNSRWLQAQDLDLFSGFSLILEACSV